MEPEQVSLAAIMFTDIVGYTSLTESNEAQAMKLLDDHRKIVRPLITLHGGKEVKTMGDAFLVEFGSAAEATKCAFEIQQALYNFNSNREPDRRILLRIGIHLGDVIHSDSDVYGDAVNVCSRIERFSDPGGISISRQVYDSVRNKLREVTFESLGLKQMKNVKSELEVFKLSLPWADEQSSSRSRFDQASQPKNKVAVLPFVNISPDPLDEFFADGLTEELISHLSQAKDLRVIARTSAMNYKNERQKKIREIGHELGAGTIVEGSVRKAGSKVRVTVQVVNAASEERIWSSTYDRDLNDIFEIQSDIATKVADSFSSPGLAPLIREQIQGAKEREETNDVTAYTYFLRGRHILYGESESSVRQAIEFFNRAIEKDPTFARAYVGRAEAELSLAFFGHAGWLESTRKAQDDVERALDLDPDLAEAHARMSLVHFRLDEFTLAEQEARKAVELNPSLAEGYAAIGHMVWTRGQVREALPYYETAYKLDPLREENILMLGEVYYELGREEDAIRVVSSAEHLFPQTTYSGAFWLCIRRGDYAKAAEFFEKLKFEAGSDSLFTLALQGVLYAYQGEREKALEIISRIEKSTEAGSTENSAIGDIHFALGDIDKFFEYMNRANEIHALPLGNLVNGPQYGAVRKDPRFRKLLEKFPDLKVQLPS
jgi:adenylate cyclase